MLERDRKGIIRSRLWIVFSALIGIALTITLGVAYESNYSPEFGLRYKSHCLNFEEPMNITVCDTLFTKGGYRFLYCKSNISFEICDNKTSKNSAQIQIAKKIKLGKSRIVKEANSNLLLLINESDTLEFDLKNKHGWNSNLKSISIRAISITRL